MTRRLRTLHAVAAALHLGQAGVLTYMVAKNAPEATKWPITRLGWTKVLTERTKEFDLGLMIPAFPFLSSMNHLVSAGDAEWYDAMVERKFNWMKWVEFSVSAGIMTVIIAILSGVTEARTLASLAVLNAALQMMGMMIEKRKSEDAPRGELVGLLLIAWGIFSAMWVQIITSFYTITSEGTRPPKAVYSIIWTMLSLFTSFGVVQTLYCLDMMTFEAYEMAFIGLSLSSKTLLSWLVFGGVISSGARFEEE